MSDSGQRRIGNSPAERIDLYQTWSNPVRRRILSHLGEHGPANSTSLARALGESTGTTSYHLRKLAEQHLIEEDAERSDGRSRWWRACNVVFRNPPRSQMTPEELAAADELLNLRVSRDIELYLRFVAEYDTADGWCDGDRFRAHLTKEEVRQFAEDYQALLRKYLRPVEDAPPGARTMAVRFYMLPENPLDDSEGGADTSGQ
ncbi:ArsR/SmtB family transcription factor [Nocardia sp. NBC_01327]|uniref:ArsR/SmtB family transcription factor n=1 Tax=Nocardia sp. NBC_01327 TaxID=2903593 RepID=UPI002E1037F2|nr:helix-turn-helix domain-containing protein [Nocardia sp. NBC_01327]